MASFLDKLLAQANPFDGGRSWASINKEEEERRRREAMRRTPSVSVARPRQRISGVVNANAGQPRQRARVATPPPNAPQNRPAPVQSLISGSGLLANKAQTEPPRPKLGFFERNIVDRFSANTELDKWKRNQEFRKSQEEYKKNLFESAPKVINPALLDRAVEGELLNRQNRFSELNNQPKANWLKDRLDANTTQDRLSRLTKGSPEVHVNPTVQGESRGTLGQITHPLIGSVMNARNRLDTGALELIGQGIEQLPGTDNFLDKTGQAIQRHADQKREVLDRWLNESRFTPQARAGENSVLTNLSSGAGSLATALALTAGTGNPYLAATTFGVGAAGEQADEARDAGVEGWKSLAIGGTAGTVEGGLEALGINKLFKAAGANKLVNRALQGFITEALQEASQSLGQDVVSDIYKDVDYSDALKQAFIEGGYGGILGSGGAVSINVVKQAVSDPNVRNLFKGNVLENFSADKLVEKADAKVAEIDEGLKFTEEQLTRVRPLEDPAQYRALLKQRDQLRNDRKKAERLAKLAKINRDKGAGLSTKRIDDNAKEPAGDPQFDPANGLQNEQSSQVSSSKNTIPPETPTLNKVDYLRRAHEIIARARNGNDMSKVPFGGNVEALARHLEGQTANENTVSPEALLSTIQRLEFELNNPYSDSRQIREQLAKARGELARIQEKSRQELTSTQGRQESQQQLALDSAAVRSGVNAGQPQVPPQAPRPAQPALQSPELELQAQQTGRTGSQNQSQSTPSGRRIRGFTETVKGSQFTDDNLRQAVSATYTPKSNNILVQKAREKITYSPNEARRKVLSEGATDENVAIAGELIKLHQEKGEYDLASEMADKVAKKLTDAGRAIQAASLYNKLSPEGVLQYAQRVTDGRIPPEVAKELTEQAKSIQEMKTDSIEQRMAIHDMMEVIARHKPQSLVNKVISAWKAGLLTAPTTTGGNIIGNTFRGIGEQVSNVPATLADTIYSGITGRDRTRAITWRGLLSGAKEGASKGVRYFKTGFDERRNPLEKFDARQIYFSDSTAGKAAEAYVNGVFKLMGAQDQPFYYAAFRNSLAQQAKVAAINQGLKGQEAKEFRQQFEQNPNEAALDQADKDARIAVFQNETAIGRAARGLARSSGAVGEFIIPFRGVPSAVATAVVEYSPIGAVGSIYKSIKKGNNYGQREFTQDISKAAIGTFGLMGLGAKLVADGLMTLDYPDDDDERKLWEIEGKQPFSVKIGGRWTSLNYVQPFATIMAAGGEMQRASDEGENPSTAFTRGMVMMGKAVTEQSFLRGVSGAIGALEDPSRRAEQFFEQTAGSLVPNFIRKGASATDRTEREIEGPLQAFQAGIPGFRQNLTPRRDMFGAEVENKQKPLGIEYVDPFRSQVASDGTPLVQEIRRLQDGDFGVTPTTIKDKETFPGQDEPIRLTQRQKDRLEQYVGPAIEMAWDATIRSPEYQSMSDEERQKELRDVSEDVRAAMKVRFMEDEGIGDLNKAVDKLQKDQFAIYKSGISKIPGAESVDKNDGFKVSESGGQGALPEDDNTYNQYVEKYKLKPSPGKKASGEFGGLVEKDRKSDRISIAKKLYEGASGYEDVPDWVKQRYYKELGIEENDIEYDIAANFNSDDKASFLAEQLSDLSYEERINKLVEYRQKSLSGDYLANPKTLDLLVDAGIISYDDAKRLKSVNYDKKSKKASRKGSGRGRKKKAFTIPSGFSLLPGGSTAVPNSVRKLLAEARVSVPRG